MNKRLNMKMISVAMATYNGSKYLEEQVSSILSQTYSNFELVIVDDFSTDDTSRYLESIEKESRVRVIYNKENLGCVKSFEKAINNCQGEYVLLSDQDDVWEENKIEELLGAIGEYSLIYSDCEVINKYGDAQGYSFKKINSMNGMDSKTSGFQSISIFNSFVLGCSMMFAASLKKEILPIPQDRFNHDKWIVNIAAHKGGVKYLDQKLFKYRVHGENLSMKVNDVSLLSKIIKKFVSRGPEHHYSYDKLSEIIQRTGTRSTSIEKLLFDIKRLEGGSRLLRFWFAFKYKDYMWPKPYRGLSPRLFFSFIYR